MKITALYLFFGVLWIVLSDLWLGSIEEGVVPAQTLKGLLFVLVTALLLAGLIHRSWKKRRQLERQLRESQKMEALGRLAAGVAHDFNNLLTAINGYTEMVLAETGRDDPRRPDLQEILAAGERASTLTRQLLAFSRSARGEPEVLDLRAVVQEMGSLLRRLVGEEIEIASEYPDEPTWVEADRGQIEQILMNLAVNARDAMPDGGELLLRLRRFAVDREFADEHLEVEPGRYVLVTVSDTGCGMEEATRSRIFEPFFTTKGDEGTGLGLSTAYGIVRRHGGSIWVYSEPGEGTTFKIYLPEADPEDEGRAAEGPGGSEGAGPPRPRRPRVLVAEDDEALRRLASVSIERLGCDVVTAVDGGAALEVFEASGPFDLVVTDVLMPEMSGHDLLAA
ncbi:MAG: ATP-binding protein, partial [Thermoanaerobaculia bacterium]|nr:ATP-binding protein [Thermoanaerobaculia bacterium]